MVIDHGLSAVRRDHNLVKKCGCVPVRWKGEGIERAGRIPRQTDVENHEEGPTPIREAERVNWEREREGQGLESEFQYDWKTRNVITTK